MKKKLTLTIEDKIIDSAKKYAQKKGKRLSHLVESYLKSITINRRENDADVISPKVLKLMGVIKLPKDFNYKAELGNAISNKKN